MTDTAGDIFILGCGRSGTSMVAGLFRNAGLFMGERLYPARASNPLGSFEDAEVNRLNEDVLARMLPQRSACNLPGYGWDIPRDGDRWLTRLPLSARATATADEIARLQALTARKPFCFKDPRFCYTLDLWRPFARDPRFICVFRDPAAFVASVFQECLRTQYLHGRAVSVYGLLEIWADTYRFVLRRHATDGAWLFVRCEDVAAGTQTGRLAAFSGLGLDPGFIDLSLQHPHPTLRLPLNARLVLDELRERAASAP